MIIFKINHLLRIILGNFSLYEELHEPFVYEQVAQCFGL